MGSAISPIADNLFMEEFETKAFNTAPHPPRIWLRCVDDTSVMQKAEGTAVHTTHQLHGPAQTIHYRGSQHQWLHIIFGHLGFTRT